jgi:CBS domain-containing protein
LPEKTGDLWWLFTRQTMCVTQNESVLNAASLMQKRNFRHLPVIREAVQRLVGVLSAQDVIDSLSLAIGPFTSTEEIVSSLEIPLYRIMSIHPIVVEKGDGLAEVVKKLVTHNIGALPVVDEMGLIQGIITLRDLVGLLGTGSEPLGVRVSELATRQLYSIDSTATMADAIHLMSQNRIRRLPILSKESGGVSAGMITNKDILRLLAKEAASSKTQRDLSTAFRTKISEVMTREVISVDSEDDIRVAASRMMIFGIGGLAVSDDKDRMVGLITERDLIKKLVEIRSVDFLVQSMKFELELMKTAA